MFSLRQALNAAAAGAVGGGVVYALQTGHPVLAGIDALCLVANVIAAGHSSPSYIGGLLTPREPR